MPKQDAQARIKNFDSVTLGLSSEQAIKEAKRCLQCKRPLCVQGCPVEVDIPAFLKLIAQGKFSQAAEKIKETNNLPAICGRVCPQENQCEFACILHKKSQALAIGALERFAADWQVTHGAVRRPRLRGKKNMTRVAVVGSGPAGLTCAADLAKKGYRVSLFESLHKLGGVLVYGIPQFRLPKNIVEQEVNYIKGWGVKTQENILVGKSLTVDELFAQGYRAVFIAVGAGLPQFLGIPGENLLRVYSANEFLTRVNLMKAYLFPEYDTPVNIGKRVAVIGAGNVAFDSARCALRLQANQVFIVYRRSEKEMPARIEEIENAREEGVQFYLLTLPEEIIGDERGYVKGIRCLKMRLGKKDQSGRKMPIPIAGSQFMLEVDTVIVAIGQRPNPLLTRLTPQLRTERDGIIAVEQDTQATSMPGVYAGGDITTGADTVISAMGAGKRAARAIDNYLRTKYPIIKLQ